MRPDRLLLAVAVALAATACNKQEPPPAQAAAATPSAQAAANKPAPRERGEYTEMPTGGPSYSHTVDEAIAAEAIRGGPKGEARIFESPEEMAELIRGRSPKTMNAQFRYYLASVRMVPPKGDCKTPLLAVDVAVENLHGTPTAAIYGEFTFTQSVGGDGSALAETVAVPFHADIIGPFSNKQGGFVYATAYLEPMDGLRDNERWTQIASVNPQRLKVWFRPEVFYYADNTQYGLRTGKIPAQRTVMTCGGNDGGK
ncbi:MAG: hypothetical protein JO090_13285, partial [Rhizobacter sp.]|nr:hypothetical protein [Rhizobacter sp.]